MDGWQRFTGLYAVLMEKEPEGVNGQSYTAYGKTDQQSDNSAGDSHGWIVGYGNKRKAIMTLPLR